MTCAHDPVPMKNGAKCARCRRWLSYTVHPGRFNGRLLPYHARPRNVLIPRF
jgi:hypothetical protein